MRLYDRRCRACGQCAVLHNVCRMCGFLYPQPTHPIHDPPELLTEADHAAASVTDAPDSDDRGDAQTDIDPDDRGDAQTDIDPDDLNHYWLDLGSGG